MEIQVLDRKDNLKGIISSLSFMLLLLILLKFITYTQVNPKPLEEILKMEETPDEITMQKFETSAKQGGGSGQPTKAPLAATNVDQMEKTLRDPNSESKETAAFGESNHSNQDKSSNNQASTTVNSEFAFKSGGSGGGDNGGKGKGFGKDDGDGSGPGNGEGKKPRIRLNDPNTENIASDQSCKINLKLTINAEGDVIKAENIVSKTTTTNQVVIKQVISNVKSQVKYNKVSGSSPEIVFITLNISAK
ncbi:MAG: hypothetical protein V4622_04040 [Bacteroidota bacterium]